MQRWEGGGQRSGQRSCCRGTRASPACAQPVAVERSSEERQRAQSKVSMGWHVCCMFVCVCLCVSVCVCVCVCVVVDNTQQVLKRTMFMSISWRCFLMNPGNPTGSAVAWHMRPSKTVTKGVHVCVCVHVCVYIFLSLSLTHTHCACTCVCVSVASGSRSRAARGMPDLTESAHK